MSFLIRILAHIQHRILGVHAKAGQNSDVYSESMLIWRRRAIATMYALLAYSVIISIAFLSLAYVHFLAPSSKSESALKQGPVAPQALPLSAPPELKQDQSSQSQPKPKPKPQPQSQSSPQPVEPVATPAPSVATTKPDLPVAGVEQLKVDKSSPAITWPDRTNISKPENWMPILKTNDFRTFFLKDVFEKGTSEAKVAMLTNFKAEQALDGSAQTYRSTLYIISIDCKVQSGIPEGVIYNTNTFLAGNDLDSSGTTIAQTKKNFDSSDPMYRLACPAGLGTTKP